jgi:hypothetical protein
MSVEAAVSEIETSKNTIEDNLEMPVTLFAYPNGKKSDFNVTIKNALRDHGFVGAVSTIPGVNTIETDPFELRRDQMWGADATESVLRLGWWRCRN